MEIFESRIFKIMVMNWTFVAAYVFDIMFDVFLLIVGVSLDLLILHQIHVLTFIFSIYVPIGVVFLNHFKNILSVNRLFKMFWSNEDTES